jgi:hypothetical protein
VDLPFKNDLYISMLDKFGNVFIKKGWFQMWRGEATIAHKHRNSLFHIVSEKYFKIVNMIIQVNS